MNNTKSNIFIFMFLCILGAGVFGLYRLQLYVASYSERVAQINTQLKTLEESKSKAELYRKILSKGSKEQEQMDAYILSGDNVFAAMTALEKDVKKIGLTPDDGLVLTSITARENETLTSLHAREIVVGVALQGASERIDAYIVALASLPYVSHIEKVTLNYSDSALKTKALVTLIITELI